MARVLRKTFGWLSLYNKPILHGRRLINVDVCGISWHEALEACLGFLDDEDTSSGHFSSEDLKFLIELAQKRLHQTNIGAGLPCDCSDCKQPEKRFVGSTSCTAGHNLK
jgi:hypothetical protein